MTEEHFFDNFKTVVASADEDGYTAYWLGRGFQAGGLQFRGPFADDIGFSTNITGGGAQFHYQATIPSGGEVVVFISLFSQQAWMQSPQNRPASAGATQHAVTVGANSGLLTTVRGPAPMEAGMSLQLQLGQTTLFVVVPDTIPRTPGPNPNPLIDEQAFLSVMQNLRPYP